MGHSRLPSISPQYTTGKFTNNDLYVNNRSIQWTWWKIRTLFLKASMGHLQFHEISWNAVCFGFDSQLSPINDLGLVLAADLGQILHNSRRKTSSLSDARACQCTHSETRTYRGSQYHEHVRRPRPLKLQTLPQQRQSVQLLSCCHSCFFPENRKWSVLFIQPERGRVFPHFSIAQSNCIFPVHYEGFRNTVYEHNCLYMTISAQCGSPKKPRFIFKSAECGS